LRLDDAFQYDSSQINQNSMTDDKLFNEIYIELVPFPQIRKNHQLEAATLSKKVAEFDAARKDEIKEIRRVRQLFNNKKAQLAEDLSEFSQFYVWHFKQHKIQEGRCYYCKTEEKVIRELFESNVISKRINRGIYLEIERRDSQASKNIYTKENCVLACYFCNNDKSQIFTESDYFDYLKDRKSFFEQKHKSLKNGK